MTGPLLERLQHAKKGRGGGMFNQADLSGDISNDFTAFREGDHLVSPHGIHSHDVRTECATVLSGHT